LTKAAAEDEEEAHGNSPTIIRDVVREVICEAASRRSLSRFEVY